MKSLFHIHDSIEDPQKRQLFFRILTKLVRIEKELSGITRLQITHVSRETKKIERGLLSTPEEEAQTASILAHFKKQHNSHWENNFIFLRQELDREYGRIFELQDQMLEEKLLNEHERIDDALTTLKDEYEAAQFFKSRH